MPAIAILLSILFLGDPGSSAAAESGTPAVPETVACTLTGPAGPGEQAYRVQPGDTLSKIAAANHVDVGCLAARNKVVRLDAVRSGSVLVIPDPVAYESASSSPTAEVAEVLAPVMTPVPESTSIGSWEWTLLDGVRLAPSPAEALAVLLVALLAAFATARGLHVRSLRRQLTRPLDHGTSPTLDASAAESHLPRARSPELAVPLSLGATLYDVSRIDPGVLEAVLRTHGLEGIASIPELWRRMVEAASKDDASFGGMLSLYKGYYGEFCIRDALLADGHLVELAETTNQEGWDAIVDGIKVQFKAGLSDSSISTHFARFRDIPVVTVAEHADKVRLHESLTALPGVSGEEIQETAASTLEALMDVATLDSALDCMPWIAGALRARRSGLRFLDGEIDGETALEFAAVDVFAPLLGGLAGGATAGEMGEALGEVVDAPEVGRAIGRVLGVTIGVVTSGKLGAMYKERHLRRATREFQVAMADFADEYHYGLRERARALEAHGRRFGPTGRRAVLWPDLSDVAAEAICEENLRSASKCRQRAAAMEREVSAAWSALPEKTARCAICHGILESPRIAADKRSWKTVGNTSPGASILIVGECSGDGHKGRAALRTIVPHAFAAAAARVLRDGRREPVYTGKLASIQRSVEEALRRIEVEQKKLGLGQAGLSRRPSPA